MRYSSRKFLLAVLGMASAAALRYLGVIDDTAYSTVTLASLGGYFGANVWQKQSSQSGSSS